MLKVTLSIDDDVELRAAAKEAIRGAATRIAREEIAGIINKAALKKVSSLSHSEMRSIIAENGENLSAALREKLASVTDEALERRVNERIAETIYRDEKQICGLIRDELSKLKFHVGVPK